jgi:hypothetical protein
MEPSQEGGETTSGVFTEPSDHFQSLRDRDISRINISTDRTFWSISMAAPAGEELAPGIYPNTESSSFRTGRAAGLDISRGSGGCSDPYGKLTIHQIAYDATGTITMLEASLVQRCGPTAPALRGELRYRATPLSYRYTLADDQPETAASHTYRGATSLFYAWSNRPGSIMFSVSGDRMSRSVEFAAPAGEALAVGTYRNVQLVGQQEPGRPGLSADGLYCSPVTGTFTIKELEKDDDGQPTALSAAFTLKCQEYPSPENPNTLKGTIHFHA